MIGVKKDDNKVRPSLVLSDMPRALLAVAEVATFGAKKYSDGNWLHVDGALSRYTDAKDRHRLQGGIEARDSESGLLHAAHEAWNALAVLELKLRAIAQSAETGNHVSSSGGTEPCMIRDSERVTNNWPESADARIDIIGQNGPTAEHYTEMPEDVAEPLTRTDLMQQTWFMNSATLEDRDAFIANGVPVESLEDWTCFGLAEKCGFSDEYEEVCSWSGNGVCSDVGDSEIHRIGNSFYWGAPE